MAIEEVARTNSNNVAFQVPVEHENEWKDITYKEFWDDVTRVGAYWSRLERFITVNKVDRTGGAGKRTVVGLWISGKTYNDLVHVFSLERAGYITQSIATYVKDVDIVQNLFEQSGAKVVLCDTNHFEKTGIEALPLLTDEEVAAITKIPSSELNSTLPPLDGDADELLFIQQTTGSSSGRPKFVPIARRWMDANVQKCHIEKDANLLGLAFLRIFLHAECTVLTPTLIWEANELVDPITRCGITDVSLYPSLATAIIEKAKASPLLINITDIKHFRCRFGSTEVGSLFSSEPGEPRLLRFYQKFDYEFIPVKDQNGENTKLSELVVLPTSPDCPVPALRDPIDGKYHTKDLFEFVRDGAYISRGIMDGIIIAENGRNCDTKYIENRVKSLCHDIISTLILVGQGRPSPALLVEPLEPNTDISALQETLSNSMRLESLNSPRVVKGTVIRSKAESMFRELLDNVYSGDSI
ncbi:hypothetical protein Clacol_003319 [Clathrus columnatus]|uniref:AMP-dependent synthetase/ligase domain-containing protein n=1 Tax=Clathrus columnatus TaxID=1419009 RepID=A0AAV5A609_9AGAM|nr:hypothetical protein Clacol_003319 [Clathrus columnatus]